jgi:putative peptide zinc metalloprotease protein
MSPAVCAPPRLRNDLIISRHHSGQAVSFVVKEPASGRFFQFREVEGYLLQELDGASSIEQLCHSIEARFGAPLPQPTLEQFVERLRRLDLLEAPDGRRDSMASTVHRIRGNAFYLRLKAFNPDQLFGRLLKKIAFVFTPSFVFLSAAIILLAVSITASHWWEIGRDFQRLYSLGSLPVIYLTVLAVVTAHEFSHGLTCKYFGGSVREIGFLLLYFQPAFYCNVSDAWLFPEKSKRLWVMFAGAYFEIFVWALATVVWRLTDPSTTINYLALIVVATSGIKTLFNMNPLIKLDGYYLLSDYLELPNLRARAFDYLGGRLRKLWGSTAQRLRGTTPRERWIYWTYGLLAWAYSFWLLSFVAWHVGGALVRHYQGWGFILFALLLTGLFQPPLKTLLRRSLTWPKVSSSMSRWAKRFLRILVLGGIVAALFIIRTELRISGPFIVLPMHNADVRTEIEGIIQVIHAEEGNLVKKGALIATLTDRDYQAEWRKTKAEIEEKQARFNLLKAGARPEELDMARTVLAKAEERLIYATNRLEMDRVLFEVRLTPKSEYEGSRELVAVRGKELQESKDKLNLLLAGSRREEIEATAAELSRLQAHQRYLEEQHQLLRIFSPIDGVITTHKLKDKVGQAVKKGDLIANVHEMQTVTVEIAIPEKEIADIKIGQKVLLKAQAFPQSRFEGQVVSIAPIATAPQEPRAERTILVTTELDNASLVLKPEMTGHAKIYCDQRRLIDIASRRLVRFFKVEFWSWW